MIQNFWPEYQTLELWIETFKFWFQMFWTANPNFCNRAFIQLNIYNESRFFAGKPKHLDCRPKLLNCEFEKEFQTVFNCIQTYFQTPWPWEHIVHLRYKPELSCAVFQRDSIAFIISTVVI